MPGRVMDTRGWPQKTPDRTQTALPRIRTGLHKAPDPGQGPNSPSPGHQGQLGASQSEIWAPIGELRPLFLLDQALTPPGRGVSTRSGLRGLVPSRVKKEKHSSGFKELMCRIGRFPPTHVGAQHPTFWHDTIPTQPCRSPTLFTIYLLMTRRKGMKTFQASQ